MKGGGRKNGNKTESNRRLVIVCLTLYRAPSLPYDFCSLPRFLPREFTLSKPRHCDCGALDLVEVFWFLLRVLIYISTLRTLNGSLFDGTYGLGFNIPEKVAFSFWSIVTGNGS
ncbi:hypothetical protein NE237_005416 [Protea cynaroides]|uniref:Uncharacterized protein n=1 Tax=Protea cynaroides TaxID=273540 RepID=A0A9Q0KKP9_9MAGN|nr:hypothetical protein NE237_005416 [Protea cynaroides]